jgi:Dyp-type peroxidase family
MQPNSPNLSDIQGNILRGYRRFKFARFMLLRILSGAGGKTLLQRLLPRVTPGEWGVSPQSAMNIGISFAGLSALGLPSDCLGSFPVEFQEGMRARARKLGDVGDNDPARWDPPWGTQRVHLVIMVYAPDDASRERHCDEVLALVRDVNAGAGSPAIEALARQDAQWLTIDGKLSRKEHFGFEDGISNPDVEGVPDNGPGVDVGNPDEAGAFRKIPVGEFILGYPGEGGELAPMPLPHLLGHNGTYLVVRKLEQHVGRFRRFVQENSRLLKQVPPDVRPQDFLAAKMFGRWQDGSPLALYPEQPAGDPNNQFKYGQDPSGAACPLGAHVRRANPRDSLGFGGKLVSRRRLIRRGIAYGSYLRETDEDLPDPQQSRDSLPTPTAGEADRRGIMFLAFNAGLDQFEFVQSAWISQGDEFRQGNDPDPIVGGGERRMVIPGDQAMRRPPFLSCDIPGFVTTKGGEYFFVPSLTGLDMIGSGEVRIP